MIQSSNALLLFSVYLMKADRINNSGVKDVCEANVCFRCEKRDLFGK